MKPALTRIQPSAKASRNHRDNPASQSRAIVLETIFATAHDHASEFLRLGRAAAEQAILCGLELIRLYETYGVRAGGNGSNQHKGAITAACGNCSWPDLVQQHVGISDDTARRWMKAAQAQYPLLCSHLADDSLLENGDPAPIEVISERVTPELLRSAVAAVTDGKTLEQLMLPLDEAGAFDPDRLVGKERDSWRKIFHLSEPYEQGVMEALGISPEEYNGWHEDAKIIRDRVEQGLTPPAKCWGAMLGRNATGQGKAATDHRRNIETAFIKLKTSLQHWDSLDTEDRTEIEAQWQAIWQHMLPGTWKTTAKKAEGWK